MNEELNAISRKNLGQLLGTLEAMNCSEGVLVIVKSFFWKNLDDIKVKLGVDNE